MAIVKMKRLRVIAMASCREELLRQIETHLEKVAELAAQADVSGEELCEMLRALREENEP